MRRRARFIVLVVLLPLAVIGGCGAIVAVKLRPKPEQPRTATVKRGDVVVSVRETGVVEPIKRVEVKSKVAGRLAELAVEEGDRVEAGQLIARLEVPELEAQRDQVKAQFDAACARCEQAQVSSELDKALIESQVEQASAGLRAVESALAEAKTRSQDAARVYESKRQLLEMGGYVSQNEVDSAKAAMEMAAQQRQSAEQQVQQQRAALAIAEARRAELELSAARVLEAKAAQRQIEDSLAEIRSRLDDAVIRSPCAGVVIGRHIREGELITAVSYYGAGAPIVTIGDLSTMLVKVELNEVDVDKVEMGLPVDITVDALPKRSYHGRVTRIAPASTPRQGEARIVRFPIEITIEDADADLKTGMTANVEIVCERAEDVLWVPNDAIFEKEDEPDKQFAALVTSEENGKHETEDREVTTGLSNDARTEIVSGLEEGDEVELGLGEMPERKTIDIRRKSEQEENED